MKGLLKFITCGSVDDGKSTLIGHILYDAKLLYADQEKALALDSKVGSRSGGIDYSVRNSSGTLIDVSSVGTSVDDTGWDTTLPVLGGSGMILAAVGGLTLMTRKSRREEAGEEPLS